MNDKTPQNPDNSETTPLPEAASPPNANPAPPAAQPPAAPKPRRNSRAVLIGAGAAAAVLLIGGAGAGIAFSIADKNDDRADHSRNSVTNTVSPGSDSGARASTNDGGRSSGNGSAPSAPSPLPSSASVPADAAALVGAIDAAVAKASGKGAASVDVERDGWEVDVVLDDRNDARVHVALDGTATVRGTDSDHGRNSDPALDTARISGIVDAAIAAAGGGTIESISTDNGRDRYDVTVALGDGRSTDIELGENLEVVSVDGDD
ncbi:hypothetical protein [Leucobacter sp. wl10]|uniref:hypothetical protein n=1 Tax=Leucobacter sp. wl10 TaxID=2304677 RepID=UPI000E5AC3E4|nr:hypothetical protein [Leucobacter sp. wl10]RGE20370.1 hypothetical protein D1J51_09320 [Leucobacter sp. wl10]